MYYSDHFTNMYNNFQRNVHFSFGAQDVYKIILSHRSTIFFSFVLFSFCSFCFLSPQHSHKS